MKAKLLVVGLSVTLAATLGAFAGDQVKDSKASKAPAVSKGTAEQASTPEKGKGVMLTGSNIKQKVRRNGWITDGANNVQVIDRSMIQNSGASDLKQVLIRTGIR